MKKLFFCLALITLTACGGGGGGGGGGSSAPPEIYIPPAPEINVPDISNPDSGYVTPDPIETDGTIDSSNIGENGNVSGEKAIGIFAENKEITLDGDISITDEKSKDSRGEQSLDGYSFGAFLKGGRFINGGIITLAGDKIAGIFANGTEVINNGKITSSNGENVIGIFSQNSKDTSVKNNGEINLHGNSLAVGMYLHNSIGINNGEIIVSSSNKAVGMYGAGKNSSVVNNKKITVKGNGCGIVAGYGARGTNLGEINIQGKGYGMYAFKGGKVLNDKGGTINLSDKALGGMVADGKGSVAENRGTINIDKNNSVIKNGDEIKAINGGTIINKGTINKNGDLFVNVSGGKYIVGTEKNGSYGKITGDKINFNGDIQINSGITKGGYKNEYVLEDILKADQVTFENEVSVTTDCILYDGKLLEKEKGNISGVLVRNDKNLTDFADKKVLQTAEVFDKYYNEKNYLALDEKGKNLLNIIKLDNKETLNQSLKDLTPSIYGNINRQIIDISKNFREVQRENIFSLKDEEYGFSLIESFSDTETGDYIEGYEHFMTGFLGSRKFGKNLYMSFGYGYSDIDYNDNNSGDIHTLFVGMNKIFKENSLSFEFGFGGQYNFHENERELKSFSEKEKSDFNSYGAEIYSRVSKEYEYYLDFTPFFEINLGYYKFNSFSENILGNEIEINSDNFTAFTPKIGIEAEKKINSFKIYSGGTYSYELGETDTRLDYRYKGIPEKVTLKDKEESGILSLNAGINYSNQNISADIKGEKSFGKRDEWSIKFKAVYIF